MLRLLLRHPPHASRSRRLNAGPVASIARVRRRGNPEWTVRGSNAGSRRRRDALRHGQEAPMNQDQVRELLYQALETERGGVKVYETALRCTVNEDLREEWT